MYGINLLTSVQNEQSALTELAIDNNSNRGSKSYIKKSNNEAD